MAETTTHPPVIHSSDDVGHPACAHNPLMSRERCVRCNEPMLRTEGLLRPGHVRHQALGKCRNCYDAGRRRTRIIRATRATPISPGRPNIEPDIDDAVVTRLLAGDTTIKCNAHEFDKAIATLNGYGLSARMIAIRLGTTTRTVVRHRARYRAQQAAA